MLNKSDFTLHAPASRSNDGEILFQQKMLQSINFLQELINNVTNIALILNKDRQIVYSNKALEDLLQIANFETSIGKRLGEAINCKYSKDFLGGCGTGEHCRVCVVVNTILESQKELSKVNSESRVTILKDGLEHSLDLSISASSLKVKDELFTLLAITDISDSKRKEALDKIFYHDVINIAGGLKGLAELALAQNTSTEINSLISYIVDGTKSLLDEITAQRDLALAENNELAVRTSPINLYEFLQSLIQIYQSHDTARKKTLALGKFSKSISIVSDSILLKRILGNLIKNALEASNPNTTVTLSCSPRPEGVELSVHNHRFIPREIQLQIFQRSFSTKGSNRGLGTYSVKLLTERYLKGSVSFVSDEKKGSTFKVVLPLTIP